MPPRPDARRLKPETRRGNDGALDGSRESEGSPCRFLYLAPLTVAKGLGDLLAAAALLRRNGVPFQLVVAGPAAPGERQAWERRAREHGLDGCVTFYGPVTGAAKVRLLASADCFVHPSHSEGMPNAVLEAAAAGLPVIATAVGSLPELARPLRSWGQGDVDTSPRARVRTLPLVSPRDPAGLAQEMRRLACDAALRAQIAGELGDCVAARCSLRVVAARIDRIYRAILAGQRRAGRRWRPAASVGGARGRGGQAAGGVQAAPAGADSSSRHVVSDVKMGTERPAATEGLEIAAP